MHQGVGKLTDPPQENLPGWLFMTRSRQLLFLSVWLLAAISCGAPGVPLPPSLDLPTPVTDLKAVRKGDKVSLSWTVPSRNTDQLPIQHLGDTEICRSIGESPNPGCENPVARVAPQQNPPGEAAKKSSAKVEASYTDTLPPKDLAENSTGWISYAISVTNERGRSAGPSKLVKVLSVPVLAPPANLKAEPSAEGIVLSWSPVPEPPENENLSHVYRVYRQEPGTAPAVAGELPLDGSQTRLVDHGFEWEKTYDYRVTVVTKTLSGGATGQVEGDDTAPVRVFAHDIFPPAIPVDLQAVYSTVGNQSFVDLIWTPDSDSDLAGYNVYRREAGQSGDWTKVNAELITAPAYRDGTVRPATKYQYAVSAVDVRHNESAKSEPAEEQTP
jgi:hypothetical protein